MPVLNLFRRLIATHRMRAVALLLVMALLAPHPATGQFDLIDSLIGIIGGGLGTLNNLAGAINSTLLNTIRPLLQGISGTLTAVQQIVGALFDFQRNVIYPQQAIDNARLLIGQVTGIYNSIRAIWSGPVRSTTLASPRSLEDVLLSKDAGRIGQVESNFTAVYTPLPPATEAHPFQRDLIDSRDAAAQAAMKRSIAIDAIADQELLAAERMMAALQGTAPGTAEMIGAQAGAWLVRSHAYTQQAMAELMRLRSVELAAQSALVKENARYVQETRRKLTDLNK
ncbi:MAG: hypothetical protein IPJ98_00565 [Bryobacterales bacterium]|nr:hypothetical protein [Bryobacterales bacterium]